MHFDGQALQIEFVQGDTILNVFKSKAKSITLPLSRISHVEHKKGWFGDKFIIQAKTLKDCEGMPGSKAAKFKLKVKKSNRSIIENFIVDFDLALSQLRLDQLEQGKNEGINKLLDD